MTLERCGEPTKGGEPCTMKRGHRAGWHRARAHEQIEWRISRYGGPGSRQNTLIEHGDRALDLHRQLRQLVHDGGAYILEVER